MAHSSRVSLGRTFKDNLRGIAPGMYQAHGGVAGAKVTPKASEAGMPPMGMTPDRGLR